MISPSLCLMYYHKVLSIYVEPNTINWLKSHFSIEKQFCPQRIKDDQNNFYHWDNFCSIKRISSIRILIIWRRERKTLRLRSRKYTEIYNFSFNRFLSNIFDKDRTFISDYKLRKYLIEIFHNLKIGFVHYLFRIFSMTKKTFRLYIL